VFAVNSTCSIARIDNCDRDRSLHCCEDGCVCHWYGSESTNQCESGNCFETNGVCGEEGSTLNDVITGGGNALPLVIGLSVCLLILLFLRHRRNLARRRRVAEVEATRNMVASARTTIDGQVPTAVACADGPVVGLPVARYGVADMAAPSPFTAVSRSQTAVSVERTEISQSYADSHRDSAVGYSDVDVGYSDVGRTATATSYDSNETLSRVTSLQGVECKQCRVSCPPGSQFCTHCGKSL